MNRFLSAVDRKSVLRRFAFLAILASICAFSGVFTLPPLDRDEARFAQASAQMLESGDFITIRFQTDERNKKPAGVYWAQAASAAALTDPRDRHIWAWRIPSALAAIASVLITARLARDMFDDRVGFFAGLFMATAPVVIAESAIAKTDAILLFTICLQQWALFVLLDDRNSGERPRSPPLSALIGFWTATALGVLVKGPIAPMIAALTILAFWFLRRPPLAWRTFRPLLGAAIVLAIVAPWAIAVGVATEGRFFQEALGGDMAAKLSAAQESHWGPPGYHGALAPLLLFPAAALLPASIIAVYKKRLETRYAFIAAWLAPTWVVFELTMTKLPHYTLPVFPALAIAAGAGLHALGEHGVAKRAGLAIYALMGAAFVAAPLTAQFFYRTGGVDLAGAGVAILTFTLVAAAIFLFLQNRTAQGALTAVAASAFIGVALTSLVLPSLDRITLSPKLDALIAGAGRHAIDDDAPPSVLAGYYEPSAVFLLGTQTEMSDGAGAASWLLSNPQAAAVVEASERNAFDATIARAGAAVTPLGVIEGVNYSNGKKVRLHVLGMDTTP